MNTPTIQYPIDAKTLPEAAVHFEKYFEAEKAMKSAADEIQKILNTSELGKWLDGFVKVGQRGYTKSVVPRKDASMGISSGLCVVLHSYYIDAQYLPDSNPNEMASLRTSLGEKTLNSLINGKLLDDNQKLQLLGLQTKDTTPKS